MKIFLWIVLIFSEFPYSAYSQERVFHGENCAQCHTQIRDRAPGQKAHIDGNTYYSNGDEHDVIIVGGGLAGLSAAYFLKGQNVLVLEKEDKVGGKVRSESWGGNSYGVAADYMFQPYWKPIIGMFKDLDIKGDVLPSPTNAFLFPDGKLVYEPLSKEGRSKLPISAEGKKKLDAMMKEWNAFSNNPVVGSMPPVPPKIPAFALKLDQETFHDHLMKKYGTELTEDFVRRYELSLFGATGVSAFAATGFVAADYDADAKNITWEKGPGVITEKLADRIGDDHIVTGALVTYVSRDSEGVQVVYNKDGKQYLARAKAVVMAIPSPVAKHLLLGMPKWKADALDKVRYSAYPKALIALNRRFDLKAFDVWPMQRETVFTDLVQEDWGRQPHPPSAHSETVPNTAVPDVVSGAPGAPAQVIDAYLGMGEAEGRVSLINTPDEQLSQKVQDDFLKVFPELKPEDIHGIRIIRWGHAMPVPYPGYMTQARPQVAKPVERVFFAGVDTQMPCIEGAIASGYVAANQVRSYLKHSQPQR